MLEITGLSDAGATPSPWSIRLVLSVMPALLLGSATLLLLRFRLGEMEHLAVRAGLAEARGQVARAPAA